MLDKRITDNIKEAESDLRTVIVAGTKVKGEVTGGNELFLEGEFDGDIKLDSLLLLRQGGKLKGKVETENIIIEGEMEGEIIAKNKIEVRTTGNFKGSIICRRIAIEEGAFFQGKVTMEDGTNITPTVFKEKRKDLKNKI